MLLKGKGNSSINGNNKKILLYNIGVSSMITNTNKKMKRSKIALCLALAGICSSGFAAEVNEEIAQEDEVERIQITGSNIKRTALEGSLPLTIFSKADLVAQGISSAEQLLLQLNIAGNGALNLASNAGIVGGSERGNNGASSADLRGQGPGSTLVLLNGRRVATHGMKGRSVDLNSIPMAAIERVEVLRDGASAIYGTDAIGGVINFILKKNYQGAEVSAFADVTEAGGGDIFRMSLLAGTGDLNKDGYNIMATLSASENKVLRGDQRDFTNTFQPDRGLSPDTRGTPYGSFNDRGANGNDPDHIRYNLIGDGLVDPITGLNNTVPNLMALPGQPGCDAFENTDVDTGALWNRPNETNSCAWDYPRAAVLQQPVEKIDFVTRGTYKLAEDHEIFAEIVASEVVTNKVFEPNQMTPWNFYGNWYPESGSSYGYIVDTLSDYYGADQLNIGAPISFRWRCMDCGSREIETTTTASRFLIGGEGTVLTDWDYQWGVSRASSESKSELGGGYHYTEGLAALFGSGTLNPFLLPGETQTQAAMDGLEAASARGVVLYGGESTMTQVDFSITGDTGFELPGGTIAIATGIDLRREEYKFNGDARAAEERPTIYGAPFDDGNALASVSRDIKAVFVEALLPVFDQLEVNLAARYDHYEGFGGTTNPKVGIKYTPTEGLLFRAGYSTGFRAPSFNQLYNGVSAEPYTGLDLADPLHCEGGIVQPGNPQCEPINPTMVYGGKDDLAPEESKQSSLGFVWAATDNVSLNVDWWEIIKEGTIQTPGLDRLIENYDLYSANFLRGPEGNIVAVDNRYINAGERTTSGIELGVLLNGDLAGGQWNVNFNGSYLIEDKKKLDDNIPYGDDEVGTHSRGNIPLEWKYTLMVNYIKGDWAHTLTQIYRDSYLDEVPPGIESGLIDPPNWNPVVSSYTTYNYAVAFNGFEDVSVVFGVKNLLDQDPSFTAHQNDYSPGAAYDPRVADPRGRSYTLKLDYRF